MKIDISDLIAIVAIVLIVTGSYLISWPVAMIAVGVLLIGAALLVEKMMYIKRKAQQTNQTAGA